MTYDDEAYKGSVHKRLDKMKADLSKLVHRFNDSEDHDLALDAQTTLAALAKFEQRVITRGLHEWQWDEPA